MVFGLFTRKSTLDDASPSPDPKTNDEHPRLPTPTPSIPSVSRHSPVRFSTSLRGVLGGSTTDLTLEVSDPAAENVPRGADYVHTPAQPPPVTPSLPSADPDETQALYDLLLTIPAKTVYAYTLSNLRPQTHLPPASSGSPPDITPTPPSPTTVAKLTTFFSTLAPPPLLHCVRCHEDFHEIENEEKDKACRVPHDDDSALVSRISKGGFETHWSCCGQITSGNGSEGGPDGWCYEGTHTVDVKRARFREDSTIHDDKLTSCLILNCHGIRDQFPPSDSHPSPSCNVKTPSPRKSDPSPTRSRASVVISRTAWKRPRKPLKEASGSEIEADTESVVNRGVEIRGGSALRGHKGSDMAVDEPNASSKPKIKTKSRPISRVRPKPGSFTSPVSIFHSNTTTLVSAKPRATAAKPKSISRTLLSQSHTHLASDSEASNHSRPRTRSRVREESRARDASRVRPASKLTKVDLSKRPRRGKKAVKPVSQPPSSEEEPEAESHEYEESDSEERGRDRKKRRVGRV